jgi:hypothetical protein
VWANRQFFLLDERGTAAPFRTAVQGRIGPPFYRDSWASATRPQELRETHVSCCSYRCTSRLSLLGD